MDMVASKGNAAKVATVSETECWVVCGQGPDYLLYPDFFSP